MATLVIVLVKNAEMDLNTEKLDTMEIGFCVGNALISETFTFGGGQNSGEVTQVAFNVENES